MQRPTRDIDLYCTWPNDAEFVRQQLRSRLVRHGFATQLRVDRTGPDSLRVTTSVPIDGAWRDVVVDLTFAWPEAIEWLGDVWGCPLSTVVARKLGVVVERGPRAWRAKDLGDVWWTLRAGAVTPGAIDDAMRRDVGWERWWTGPGRAEFWRDEIAVGRWHRFVEHQHGVSAHLHDVVDDLNARLRTLVQTS